MLQSEKVVRRCIVEGQDVNAHIENVINSALQSIAHQCAFLECLSGNSQGKLHQLQLVTYVKVVNRSEKTSSDIHTIPDISANDELDISEDKRFCADDSGSIALADKNIESNRVQGTNGNARDKETGFCDVAHEVERIAKPVAKLENGDNEQTEEVLLKDHHLW